MRPKPWSQSWHREESARQALSGARKRSVTRGHVREVRDAVAHLDIEGHRPNESIASCLERLDDARDGRPRWPTAKRRLRGVETAAEAAQAAAAEAGSAVTHSAAVKQEALQARQRRAKRSVLARAEANLAELDATVQALERLDRERVGFAPAAAKLLGDRDQFGEGAVLGPLSDFLTAGTADAAVVEQYLGATVHAVVVRD